MVATGDDDFDVIGIEEVVYRLVIGQVIDVDDKWYRTYGKALVDTAYDFVRLE